MGRAFEVRKKAMAETGAKKSALYNRMSKEVYLAAKNGSPDPKSNLALKNAIEKAKSRQVPNDVIERAIKKSQGNDADNFTAIRYEGFGAGGSAVIVDALTTNVNRAVAEVRSAFTKNNGKLGVSGSVSHLFNNVAIIAFDNLSVDSALELLMNAEVEINDIVEEEGQTVVYGPTISFNEIKNVLEQNGISHFSIAEITTIAEEEITLTNSDDIEKFNRMLATLDDLEDVQEVYHNVSL